MNITGTYGMSDQHGEDRGTILPCNERTIAERQRDSHNEDNQISHNIRGTLTIRIIHEFAILER